MRQVMIVVALCALAGCSGKPTSKTGDISTGANPFSVLPQRALVQPGDYQSLPTPGGANRADINPNADAIIALGGNPNGVSTTAADNAILSYAASRGVDPNIRPTLGDGTRRSSDRLDAYSELERLRAMGVSTPSAPPRP